VLGADGGVLTMVDAQLDRARVGVTAAVAMLLTLPGCAAAPTVCLADLEVIFPNVVVQLADDWPEGRAATVVLQCVPACAEDMTGNPTADTLTSPIDGSAAGFDVLADPDTVVVTVLDLPGAELAEAELEFERVSGSEECSNPLRATITVPAPAHPEDDAPRGQTSTTRTPFSSRTGTTRTGAAPLVEAPSDHR
jgi:hypothetical protein